MTGTAPTAFSIPERSTRRRSVGRTAANRLV